jgi:RNA polymerase sigma-70 factor (ECF subfamily)
MASAENMNTTPVSLLEQLRRSPDETAWTRFVHLYSPLLFGWARQAGLDEADASDLVQDVFVILLKELPRFELDPTRSFRAWLKTVVLNRWRNQIKRQARAPSRPGDGLLAAVSAPDDSFFEEREYRRQLLRRALELLRQGFQPTTWKAFQEHGMNGRPAVQVAAELGLTVGAVYAAKCRVLGQLREHLRGLLE